MRTFLLLITFITFCLSVQAQQTYTIGNETLELKTEVEGNLDLLWTIDNSQYRYFVRTTNGTIQELTNTKNPDTRKYQEEYKTVLSNLTSEYGLTTDKVNLTLYSLKEVINKYNSTTDLNYDYESRSKLQSRIGIFGGITNQPLVDNPDNKTAPFFGADFEVFSKTKLQRHALFFQARHSLKSDEFKYSSTQLSIGYRFRFVNQAKFNFYGNLKIATFDFINAEYTFDNPSLGTYTENSSALQVPFILGIGADIKITKNGYIMLAYHDMYALFVDNGGNFPIDFAIGFKLDL
ncbi:hypothetical protein [Hanstruepera flava]|uniref:hypothetical protein n=1 Tax=Hanstruepera flava TaxID=2930218 RepID=UPI002027E25E|nr:hypothetical protein [Hanstruepera flava]